MLIEHSQETIDTASVKAPLKLQKIVIAYDGSNSAKRALHDAELLAFQHHAELLILFVDGADAISEETGLSNAANASLQVTAHGIHNQWIHRIGAVHEVIHEVCCDFAADLLMIGAYGHGSQERQTLGSSTEKLLRTESCPVLTYGPAVAQDLFARERGGPVLFTIALPCIPAQLPKALSLIKLFDVSIEVFHTVAGPRRHDAHWFENECLSVAKSFREQGVHAQWNVVYGDPALSICNMSDQIKSPFILMPLKRRNELSTTTSDNVAARVVRRATVPVLSYRFN
ncbi:universal stress protein [Terriglobus roseus]|uniref:Nucleotide-binding universal stress protein, UspA family n=1 Tax=Terriglobus roseus TaxID=392734 RepID=A0A1H4L152_9BACT|nr:universal stress protein [Terriglobus roseus]SEB64108.1 Nucleotide-binding universal stress protein, UspA family [Terriglobus roseus]